MLIARLLTTRSALAVGAGAALLATAGHAWAQASFQGKTIDAVIGSTAGGGTSGTTRLVGSFLEKYLPGGPKMRYRNIPGGHGAKALNYIVDKKVKPDGTTWVGGSSAHIDPQALRRPVVEFNPTQFHYFGGVTRGGSIVVIRKDRLANLTDKTKPPVVVGVLDGNRSWEQLITWGKEYLGWNVRFVVGYPGTSFLQLAIRRGETHMTGTSNIGFLNELFKSGEYVGVSQLGDGGSGAAAARSEFKDIPTINQQMAGKLTGLAAETFAFWSKLNELDKWYALPPGTPPDVVSAYRTAWTKLTKDPEFIKQGKLQFSDDFEPVDGDYMADAVNKTAYPRPEIIQFMEQLQVKHGLPATPLSDEELAQLAKERGLDKTGPKSTVKSSLVAVGNGGRDIQFEDGGQTKKVSVSSSKSKVMIGGKEATRADLKSGMNCTIEFEAGAEAQAITCQ